MTRQRFPDTLAVGRRLGLPDPGACGEARVSGELLADELAHDAPVGAARDLRHHVRHDAPEVAHAGRSVLGDRVVDDRLELLFRKWLWHELLEDGELLLFRSGALFAAALPEGLRRLDPPLALSLQHLQLLLVGERPLQLLLRGAQARQDQPQRIAAGRIALAHGALQLVLDAADQAHAAPRTRPPSRCQWRWKIVCPAPSPTLMTTR